MAERLSESDGHVEFLSSQSDSDGEKVSIRMTKLKKGSSSNNVEKM